MQHLCEAGFQPRAFAGRKDHNGEITVGHSSSHSAGAADISQRRVHPDAANP
jgi:hypothetical protein